MTILDRIDAGLCERLGTFIAVVGCVAIAAQCLSEWRTPGPGSLSPVHVVGYLIIFGFWVLYGLRFRRPAIWIGNLVAVALQGLLLAIWLLKHRSEV